jgi:hypothetical protein
MKCVRWYCLRWRIEEWHGVLKSGCGVLEHQNHLAESLGRAISIDAVVAWRIMLLALLGRELPELSCGLLFNSWECEVLQLMAQIKALISRRCNRHHSQAWRIFESPMRWTARISIPLQRIHALPRHGQRAHAQGGALMNALRHICGARAALGRVRSEKSRNNLSAQLRQHSIVLL